MSKEPTKDPKEERVDDDDADDDEEEEEEEAGDDGEGTSHVHLEMLPMDCVCTVRVSVLGG